MSKLRGKARQRARAKARKTHYTAKELFGENSKWNKVDAAGNTSTGKRWMWDALGGQSPFAMFSQAHETAKLIKMMEEDPVNYSTKAIKKDWDAIYPEISTPRHSMEMVAGYFMAIVPAYKQQIGHKQAMGLVIRPPAPGKTTSQWSDHLDSIRERFGIKPLKEGFVLMGSYCTPDLVWEHFCEVSDHFAYAAVAFSNTIKFQVLAEDCQWQAVWNGKREFSDVTDLGEKIVSRKLMETI